jgi:integrase
MNVSFYVNQYKKDKDDNAPFEVVITTNGTRTKFTLKHKVKYYVWNNKKQEFVIDPNKLRTLVVKDVKTSQITNIESEYKVSDIATYEQILKHLEVVKTKLYDSENKLLELGYAVDAKTVKDMFFGKIKGKQHSLNAYYTDFLETKAKRVGKEIVKDTYQKYETTLKHFKNFIKKKYKRDDIQLIEINLSMIGAFFSYLLTDVPMSNDSAVGYMKKLKAVLSQAQHDRIIESNPMFNFPMRLEPKEIIFLTKEEVSTIYRKEIENKRLEKVRDMFVLSCFTALSFIDQKRFDAKKDIKKDEKGKIYILKERKKSNVPAIIPLLPTAIEILEKYNYKLPIPSNQKYNAYLKEIQDICSLKKELHTHLCRHTCATLLLNNGVPLLTVSHVLGHASTKETEKTYARFLPSSIIEDVNNVADNLEL